MITDEIKLIQPSMEYADQIMQYRQEIIEANDNDSFAGCGNLMSCETAEEWIIFSKRLENVDTCLEGYVPANTYLAVRTADNCLVGIIDLRHHINHPILSAWGGHIGYSVRPRERRKGYAKEMLRLNLLNCKELGITRVMVTCDHDNIASERTIQANGGIYEKDITTENGTVIKRYWIEV